MTERVFAGMAALFAISHTSYRLVSVGPEQAWIDLGAAALGRLGLHRLARWLEERLLRRRWAEAAAAVRTALSRGAGARGGK